MHFLIDCRDFQIDFYFRLLSDNVSSCKARSPSSGDAAAWLAREGREEGPEEGDGEDGAAGHAGRSTSSVPLLTHPQEEKTRVADMV